MFGFWEMLVYVGIVLVGLFYVWKKGVLDWGRDRWQARTCLMALTPAITDIEELKSHPALARLLEWNAGSAPSGEVRPRRTHAVD